MPRRVDPTVLEGFFAEVRSYLPRIRAAIEAHLEDPSRDESLEEAFRLLHSIKGSASMVGVPEISEVARDAESLLERRIDARQPLDRADAEAVGEAVERIGRAVRTATEAPAAIDVDADLAAMVREELSGYQDEIATRLRALEEDPARADVWSEIWRPVHTLKGTAGIVGLFDVGRLAHRMEDLLTGLDRGDRALDAEVLGLLHRTSDLLDDLIEGRVVDDDLAARLRATYGAYDAMLADVGAPSGDSASDAESVPSPDDAPTIPSPDDAPAIPSGRAGKRLTGERLAGERLASESVLRVRTDRLDGLLRLVGSVTLQRNAFDRQVARLAELRTELQLNLRRLGRIGRQLESELAAGTLAPGAATLEPAGAAAAGFDSLEMDRYTKVDRLTRQLEEAIGDSAALGSGFDGLLRDVEGFQSHLGLLTRDVQERLARLRSVPFASLAGRLHRTVRVTAERRGKLATLAIRGEAAELDKNVLDEIAEPLFHLLRNAVDHGIEFPDERRAADKPERGHIEVEVGHEGTEAVIRVRDDGAGLDFPRIRERAAELGLLPSSEPAATDQESLQRLLFDRGFSTAGVLDEISGRGVGLDVVQASVDRLGGVLEVDSGPGAGTVFTIRVPGSQTILRVLLVASGGATLAMPLASVDRVESLAMDEVEDTDQGPCLSLDGVSIPVRELETSIGLPARAGHGDRRSPVVFLRVGERRLALPVERIVGVQETVVRPMSELFPRRVHGLGGAALTGDGAVVLVLNPADLLRHAPSRPGSAVSGSGGRQRPLEILIADDSLSVRQVLARLVERQGWRALVARDGQEALERLEGVARLPDVAVVDLEMPRMDGFELTRALKAHPVYRRIPIVILTTRAGQKHRQAAHSLGARDYVIKPYREAALLATLRSAAAGGDGET